jgi:hypothetical protein
MPKVTVFLDPKAPAKPFGYIARLLADVAGCQDESGAALTAQATLNDDDLLYLRWCRALGPAFELEVIEPATEVTYAPV